MPRVKGSRYDGHDKVHVHVHVPSRKVAEDLTGTGQTDRLNPLRCPSIGTLVTLGWKGAQVGHSCVPELD